MKRRMYSKVAVPTPIPLSVNDCSPYVPERFATIPTQIRSIKRSTRASWTRTLSVDLSSRIPPLLPLWVLVIWEAADELGSLELRCCIAWGRLRIWAWRKARDSICNSSWFSSLCFEDVFHCEIGIEPRDASSSNVTLWTKLSWAIAGIPKIASSCGRCSTTISIIEEEIHEQSIIPSRSFNIARSESFPLLNGYHIWFLPPQPKRNESCAFVQGRETIEKGNTNCNDSGNQFDIKIGRDRSYQCKDLSKCQLILMIRAAAVTSA